MHYFLKGLIQGNTRFFIFSAYLGCWFIGFIDILSTAIGSHGIWGGKIFYITNICGVLAIIGYYFFDFSKRKKYSEKETNVERIAAIFEPRREKEIRRIIEDTPDFVTLCYNCIHFDPRFLHCARKFSDDVSYRRVKEITIDGKKYCLYWRESYESSSSYSNPNANPLEE